MSFLDNIEPIVASTIKVLDDQLWLFFARNPDADLVKEISDAFNEKPGFHIQKGGVAGFELKGEIRYTLQFPSLYEPMVVAIAVKEVCQKHGLTCEIETTPAYLKRKVADSFRGKGVNPPPQGP